jgi:hypothetical protein
VDAIRPFFLLCFEIRGGDRIIAQLGELFEAHCLPVYPGLHCRAASRRKNTVEIRHATTRRATSSGCREAMERRATPWGSGDVRNDFVSEKPKISVRRRSVFKASQKSDSGKFR